MSDINHLIYRTLRDWLLPPDDQPLHFVLAAELLSTATTLTYDPALLPPEEGDIIGSGSLIEIDLEQILVGGVDEANNQLTGLVRGVNGTTPVTHPANSIITFAPPFSRQSIFDALSDTISDIYPNLFSVTTTTITVPDDTYVELPADFEAVQPPFLYKHNDGYFRGSVQPFLHFPPSSTSKAAFFPGVPSSTGYLTYRRRPSRPTATSDTLASLNIDPAWSRLLVVGAVATLAGSRDLPLATQEFMTERLESEGWRVGSGLSLRRRLSELYEYLMVKASSALHAKYPTPLARNGIIT